MAMIATGMVLLFLLYIYRNYWGLMLRARRYGCETEASVCRIENVKRVAYGNPAEYPMTFYYVVFRRQDGLQNEARLLNPKSSLNVGSKIKVKYLEERNDCAVLTEIVEV
jgi:hypothetical protein